MTTRVTELDFDTILTNLKAFMQTQEEFKDYDFDGSALSILLKVLAYNTHYGAYYSNMVANEGSIADAIIPRSLYSHAKMLNYLPASKSCAKATVMMQLNMSGTFYDNTYTIPKYHQFTCESVDGRNFNFVTLEPYTATRSSYLNPFNFNAIQLYQGEVVSLNYVIDPITNPKYRFEVPSANIDTETLLVQVQESMSNTFIHNFSYNMDAATLDSDSKVYFLDKSSDTNYTLSFGDGVLGRRPNTGSILTISYLVTDGISANKVRYFSPMPMDNVSSFSVSTVTAASGGSEEEDVESIRTSAPLFYATQNRAITKKDFEVVLKKDYPSIGSVSVWGGEENDPPIYGKIFISVAPKQGFVISEIDKQDIVNFLVTNRVSLAVKPEMVDPDYVYLKFKITAEWDSSKTLQSKTAVIADIRSAIIDYCETELNSFNSKMVESKLATAIDKSEPSLLGNDLTVYLEKRFTPVIGKTATYILNFNTELSRSSLFEKLQSSSFVMQDNEGNLQTVYIEEVPYSYTGIDDIVITDPGFGYLEAPLVSITGDGTNANAVARIVNGRVQSISITNKGSDYTTAIVTLTAVNGGSGATAKPIVAARYGTLRIYYINSLQQKVIVEPNAGTIDYLKGIITLSNFKPENYSNYIALWIRTDDPIVESTRSNILTLDSSDESAITINLN